ncbi:MAG: helix-turn-helix transcriptional regulator [Candidatus Jordarchaeaceae archaeon]
MLMRPRMPFNSKVGAFQLRVLEILRERPMHGYGIMNELEARTGHRPTTAALYPTLQKLEHYGFIKSKIEPGKKRNRKVFSLTKEGLEELTNVLGLMIEFCISGIQEEFEAIQKEVYCKMEVQEGSTILYPSTIYKSIHDLANAFKDKGKVVALVPSKTFKEIIDKAVKRDHLSHTITVKEGGLEKIPLEGSSVDFAVYPFTLCRCSPWATSINLERAAKEVARVLKPNGKLVVIDLEKSDHAMLRILSKNIELCGFNLSEAKKLLEVCGFKNVTASSQKGILIVEGTRT